MGGSVNVNPSVTLFIWMPRGSGSLPQGTQLALSNTTLGIIELAVDMKAIRLAAF